MALSATPFSPGAISITLDLVREGGGARARRVRIASSRPTGFSAALLVGRAASEVPGVIGRLHSLCGRSHTAASEAALAAAAGRDGAEAVAGRIDGLIAERLAEHLRSTFAGVGPGRVEVSDREVLADLRAVLASARALDGVSGGASGAIERIVKGLAGLGLGIDAKGRLATRPGSWAAEAMSRMGPTCGDLYLPTDRLTAADDAAVIAALAADPKGFSAAPRLPGRRPETGPSARAGSGPGTADGRARLAARLGEIAEAAELLDAPAADKARVTGDWVAAGRLDGGFGHAAVESPRGRLHHLARLDADGRIAAYAILAPTEWNFHADGPLAATLAANRWGGAGDAARVERIASLFDPCVGFDVEIRECGDA